MSTSTLEPSQAAALLGREIDAGFAAAFSDLSSSRSLVVDRIVARVGALPGGEATEADWALVPWRAEVTLVAGTPGAPVPGEDGETGDPPGGPGEAVRHRIAALPATTIRGVGKVWAQSFADWGWSTVGELAEADPSLVVLRAGAHDSVALPLLARARDLVGDWPPVPPEALGRSVAELARETPPPQALALHALRARCIQVLGGLDAHVAARLRL